MGICYNQIMEQPKAVSGIHEIRKIGGYLDTDQDGFIINEASPEKFQEKWKPAIAEITTAYQEHFGDKLLSVYVRGSVARGTAIDGISDLDTRAIVNLPKEQIDIKWGKKFNEKILAKYPFIKEVEITASTPEQALDIEGGLHVMLKTQAVCVYGIDISENISRIRPNREAAQHFRNLQKELQSTIDFFEHNQDNDKAKNKNRCSWIMKRILRTGFELVMEREQKYTRDLYPCYESFAKYYPEKKEAMYKTLELAINPTDNSGMVMSLLKDWQTFMSVEIPKVFGVE